MLFYACTLSPAEPTPCESVDFYGTANWVLTADSLMLALDGDFTGNFVGSIVATDSGRIVDGVLSGVLVAPLGENSFTKSGSMILHGELMFDGERYEFVPIVISGDDGFAGVTGFLEFYWGEDENLIYYVGRFCILE